MSARRFMIIALAALALFWSAPDRCSAVESGEPAPGDADVEVSRAVTDAVVGDAVDDDASFAAADATLADGVAVLYLHHTIRCETCLLAEALADSLIRTAFADETAEGRLAWVVLNVEDEGNERLVDHYELGPFGLVLSIRSGGEEVFWRELESIEDLAAYPGLFNEYLSGEVRHALARSAGELPESADTKEEDHLEDAR